MTTTTPESRARLAYTAYLRGRDAQHLDRLREAPLFDDLTEHERAGWMKSADVLWSLATTGVARL